MGKRGNSISPEINASQTNIKRRKGDSSDGSKLLAKRQTTQRGKAPSSQGNSQGSTIPLTRSQHNTTLSPIAIG